MHIYGFVENRTFLEQFVSMGVPAQFIFLWLSWPSLMRGYETIDICIEPYIRYNKISNTMFQSEGASYALELY